MDYRVVDGTWELNAHMVNQTTCGWNPEVAIERHEQRVKKLAEEQKLLEYISEEFE